MNMLIAMMNTSYETVRVTRCNLWKQQQLSIMLMLERRFFFIKYLCQKSESDTWRKEVGESREWRCFLDVTMLHQPGIKESEYVTSSVRTAERKTSSSGESDESAKAKASGVWLDSRCGNDYGFLGIFVLVFFFPFPRILILNHTSHFEYFLVSPNRRSVLLVDEPSTLW